MHFPSMHFPSMHFPAMHVPSHHIAGIILSPLGIYLPARWVAWVERGRNAGRRVTR
jgi:hypothetical protein